MTQKNYPQIQREYREHSKANPEPPEGAVKISLQSNFTVEPLAAYIWAAANGEGIPASIHIGEFGQFAQEFINPAGPLHQFAPDIVFLFFSPLKSESSNDIAAQLENLISAFQRESKSVLVVSNFIVPVFPATLGADPATVAVKQANSEIEKIVSNFKSTYMMDLDSLASHFGKEKVSNLKLHYMGSIDFSPEFMGVVANKCRTYIRLLTRAPKKVLVLDLDNTLWGGIVGEVGENGISLSDSGAGSEYVDFQKEILKLNQRGVLLAINSKNNFDDALAAIKNHPNMILRPENFSAMRINWNDKAANMRELAEELNLGLDSFVFLDDSPSERGLVRGSIPEALVPELPADPSLYAAFLSNLDAFESLITTEEDAERAKMYARQRERDAAKQQFSTVDEYLKSLNIVATVSRVDEKSFARACQLIMKTNQFNLTTKRHSEGAMRAMLNSDDFQMYVLGASDMYGDSGITGLAILKFEGDACAIDTLLLSCRILGRRIEETFLSVLAREAGKRATKMIGEYSPTKKNAQVRDFYAKAGFTPAGKSGDSEIFEITAAGAIEKALPCEYHTVILEGVDQ